LLKALADEGYTTPTPIQAQAIPGVMTGKDLLGIAQTGTGKTAAFALPILHRLAADRSPRPRRGCRVPGPVPDPRTGHPDRRELQDLRQAPGRLRRRRVRRREVRPQMRALAAASTCWWPPPAA
jgi:ATP-dependent helicase YprA (DUF1998 family)